MDNEDNTTFDYLTGDDNNVAPSDVNEAVSQSQDTAPEAMTLEEMNQHLGKNFKDKATALKAIKDTFNYVGKKKEDVAKEVFNKDGFVSKDQYETDMFYSKNSEYDTPAIRKVIDSMSKSEGISAREVVNSDSFKEIYGAVKGFNENQNIKSVLESNPRLAGTSSKLQDSFKAAQDGNKELAADLATKAVMEAYPESFGK